MINKIIEKIESFQKIALFQHIQPDGDCISSTYGLLLAIKQKFPEKEVIMVSDYEYLNKNFKFLNIKEEYFKSKAGSDFLGIIGDVSIQKRIIKSEELLKCKEVICFDHHQNTSDLNANVFWHEPDYSASALQAFEIANEFMGYENMNEETSLIMMFGILTDTGFFKYSLAKPKPPWIFSRLLKNVSNDSIDKLYREMLVRTKDDIAVQQYLLSNLNYSGEVAYIIIPNDIVKKFGRNTIKTKINFIANIEGTKAWAFFTETLKDKEHPWEVSLRSNGPNIREVAMKHNGGGHIRASGASAKNKEEIVEIIQELELTCSK